MRVIETLLSSFIIIAALSFVSIFSISPTTPGYEVTDLEKMAYGALHDLDQQGILAPLVYSDQPKSWSDLRTALKITMPVDVYFNMTIYNLSGTELTYPTQIVYGDSTTFSDAKNIASVSYSLTGVSYKSGTGYVANYNPRIVVLQLTRG